MALGPDRGGWRRQHLLASRVGLCRFPVREEDVNRDVRVEVLSPLPLWPQSLREHGLCRAKAEMLSAGRSNRCFARSSIRRSRRHPSDEFWSHRNTPAATRHTSPLGVECVPTRSLDVVAFERPFVLRLAGRSGLSSAQRDVPPRDAPPTAGVGPL
jgi:hypothetical protein